MLAHHFASQSLMMVAIYFSSVLATSSDQCPFSGKSYSVGETWHPHLQTSVSVCATCTCHQGGKYNCTSKECIPETCPDPQDEPGKCCANCVEVKPRSFLTDSTLPLNENFFSCLHRGKIYRDGQMFMTNASVEQMRRFQPDQCVQCSCKNGSITCHVPTCSSLSCSNQMRVPGNCCPLCQGEFVDCNSGGQLYAHGVIWYLNLGVNKMGCEECTCNYGQIECHPLRCPSRRRLCSTLKQNQIPERCCPGCARNRSKNEIVRGRKHDELLVDDEGVRNMCLPKKNNIAVYRSEVVINATARSQYLFIFNNRRFELHSWTLNQGRIVEFNAQHLSDDNARSMRKAFRFQLLGATNARSMQRFTNREKKLKEKCSERCANRVKRLENALKLKRIRKKCQNGSK